MGGGVSIKKTLCTLVKMLNNTSLKYCVHMSVVLFQLAKVDRYQDRLTVMAYIGQFDELAVSVQPVCHVILDHVISVSPYIAN